MRPHGFARWTALVTLTLGAGGAGLASWSAARSEAAALTATALAPPPQDTVTVYGPHQFATPTGSATNHVERFALTLTPGRRYTLRVQNGAADGSHRVSGGSVTLNGSVILSSTDLSGGGPGWSRVVQALSEDTLQVTVQGSAGAYVTASLEATADASFLVFGFERFIRNSGTPITDTRQFTVSTTAAAPYRLCIVNGNPDGSQRISSAEIFINGAQVLTQNEVNQQVGSLVKEVALHAGVNTLQLTLSAQPSGFLDLCLTATDVTPPVLTIATPAPNTITHDLQIAVTGTVQDETATEVTVNGQVAQRSGTAYSATVPLAVEGSNVITVTAIDAAGLRTDSTRTVIRDTQAPVVTLTSPVDGLITNADSVNVAGTVQDQTAVTVNVNGIPLPVGAGGAFAGKVALVDGSNILTVTATDAAANATSVVRQVVRDTIPPTLAVTAPAEGAYVKTATIAVAGTSTDVHPGTVTVNGTPVTLGADGAFSGTVALVAGLNTLTFVATDAAGNATTVVRHVTLDQDPPVVTLTAPANGFITKQTSITVSGTVTDASPVTVDANGVPLPVDGAGAFTGQVPLTEGPNTIIVTATDAATNSVATGRTGTRDTQAPVIALTEPADGATTTAASVTVRGTVTDATAVTVTVNGTAAPVGSDGAFMADVPVVLGPNTITVVATDAATNSATATRSVVRIPGGPPDPSTVASVVNRAEVTTIGDATAFLYSGANPIQTGVGTNVITPLRAAVLRGRVLDRTLQPLGSATVKVLNHPEFGQTLSRADGGYDLAVNGGGQLTLSFTLVGYLPAQRGIDVPWQDYTRVDDVVLLQPDGTVTAVDLTSQTPPVARGSVVTDADGTRQVAVIFKPGNSATLTPPGGAPQAITDLSVRVTEFTVGASGALAMPAGLPPASQYTYAVQITTDQQINAGPGATVTLAQPVPIYVENFLEINLGTKVPVGVYDAATATWTPEPSGLVVKFVNVVNGRAQLDVTGDGLADPSSALLALGIDDYEQQQLAGSFPAGTDLWRALAPRFEPLDLNFPFRFVGVTPTEGKVKAGCSSREGDALRCRLQAQTAFQHLGIVGSPYTLNYASDRTQGNVADRKLDITLTGATLPTDLLRVELEVDVAGQRFTGSFTPQANLTTTFTWDGRDLYGRLLQGTQPATVLIGYVFPVKYAAPANAVDAFGLPCAPDGTGTVCPFVTTTSASVPARAEEVLVQRIESSIGTFDAAALGLGGFTLDVQNVYDPVGEQLFVGDGRRRSAAALPPGISTVAGKPGSSIFGIVNGAVAKNVALAGLGPIARGPDGSIYFADRFQVMIQRLTPDGLLYTVFGAPNSSQCTGDNGPALSARASFIYDIEVAADGTIYFAEEGNCNRVRKIEPNGTVRAVAGTGATPFNGDNIAATSANMFPAGIAVGPDGSVYIADQNRVRRVAPDGIIRTVAGDGQVCGPANSINTDATFNSLCGNGKVATASRVSLMRDLAVGPDGSLYIVGINRVRRVTPDGIIRTYAGSAITTSAGDGGPATLAGIVSPWGLAVGPDGTMYITQDVGLETNAARVRRVTPNGIITTIAGNGTGGFAGDGGPAAAAKIALNVRGVAVGADGNLYIADLGNNRIRKVAGALPGYGLGDIVVASADGTQLYLFSQAGRLRFTVSPLTRDTIYRFQYDATTRQLVSVTDRDGQALTIERDASGRATAVVAPNGQRTTLDVDPTGALTGITDPGLFSPVFGYGSGGTLTGVQDPLGHSGTYSYGADGLYSGRSTLPGESLTRSFSVTGATSQLSFASSQGTSSSVSVETRPDGSQVRLATLPNGTTVQHTLDPSGRSVTNYPNGLTVTTDRSADPRFGLQTPQFATSVQTPGGLLRTTRTGRAVTLSDPNDPMSVTSSTDTLVVNGRITRRVFDVTLGTLTNISPFGRQVVQRFDTLGRLVRVELPGLAPRVVTYDAAGRVTQSTRSTRITRVHVGALGTVDSITDPTGLTTRFEHDALSHVTAWTRPDGRTTRFTYDANGQITSFTPPGRTAHQLTYTPTGYLETYRPPALAGVEHVTTRRYTPSGDMEAIKYPSGDSLRMFFDGVGRQNRLVFSNREVTLGYDAAGRLASANTLDGGLTYAYDGHLVTQLAWSGAIAGTLGVAYDNDLRPLRISVNGDAGRTTTYDADGLVIGVGALTITRSASNGLVSGTSIGSVTTTESWNEFGERSNLTASFNSTPVYQATYGPDLRGRVSTLSETIGGTLASYTFAYDSAGRLKEVTKDGSVFRSYEYDDNGNRTRATTPAGALVGSYDARDRLVTYGDATYTFTPDGTLSTTTTGGATTQYTYDAMGSLRRVNLPDGRVVDYVIDGRNTRVGKKVNGVLTQGWLYDQAGRITAELGPMNQVVSIFVYGSRRNAPDYMLKGAATYRFVTDLLGSVRLVIDAQTGAIVQRIDYDPFGDVILDTQQGFQPFGFAGGLYDPDTRLVRFGARDLDPRTGRWTASDPLLHRSGDANLYAYTANDPVNVRDPEGENELVELEAGMTIADVVAATEAAEAAVTQAMLKNMVSGCVSGAVWEAAESGRLGWNVLGACARDGAVGAFTGYAGKWAEEFAKGMDSEVGKWALGCFVNGSMQVAEDFMSTDANSAPQSVPRHVLIQAAMGCVSADFAEVEEYDSAFLKLMKQRQNPWYGRLIGAFQDVIWEGTARIVEGIIDIAVDGKTP